MRYLLKIILIVIFCFGPLLSYASERDSGYLDIPTPDYFYPDTNFTLMSHGFPTSPRDQLLINGHLYVAMGAYIVIYEVLPDGRLQETCSKMTDPVLTSMAHDGSYLYLSGVNGLQIYDGTNYTNPQLIGFNPMRYTQVLDGISVIGDSVYYAWDDSGGHGHWFGIMDVHDRSNPQVSVEFENEIRTNSLERAFAYSRYLIVLTRVNSSHTIFGVYDLDSPPGTLVLVDSISASFNKMRLYENRLYSISYNNFRIYEFTGGTQPEFRSAITFDTHIEEMAEAVIYGNRYAFVTTWNAHVYKINVNDIVNPVIIDSLIVPENMNHIFRGIEQSGDFSYAMTTRRNYYVEHPGVHVIDWTLPGGPEMVQTAKKYSYCNTVKVIGDVAYAETDNDGILVVDLSDKSDPQVVDLGYALWEYNVAGDSNTLFAQDGNTVKFYDLSDPLAPVLDWTCQVPISSYYHISSYVIYDTLLIANYFYGSPNGPAGVIILGISDRNNVQTLFDGIGHDNSRPLHLDYPRLYISSNDNGIVKIYDISDPTDPEQIGELHNSGSVNNVYTYENYVYLAGGNNRVYHWTQWNHIVFDRLLDFRPEFMVAEQGRMFFWGPRELGGPAGVQVWDVWQDPVNPVFSGYHFDGTLSAWRKIDVEWPYVYIPGGDKGTNFPNPFNSSTTIEYFLPKQVHVRIDIYDLLGRKVKTLIKEEQRAGTHSIVFDASDLSTGMYFVRLNTSVETRVQKVVLLK
jgi:hypothetical protein